jgi:hypothetical protein
MLSLGRPRPRPNKDTVASTDTSAPATLRAGCRASFLQDELPRLMTFENSGSDKPNPVWGVEVGTDRIKSVSTLD